MEGRTKGMEDIIRTVGGRKKLEALMKSFLSLLFLSKTLDGPRDSGEDNPVSRGYERLSPRGYLKLEPRTQSEQEENYWKQCINRGPGGKSIMNIRVG